MLGRLICHFIMQIQVKNFQYDVIVLLRLHINIQFYISKMLPKYGCYLKRHAQYNVEVNKYNFKLYDTIIEFLGRRIDSSGIFPTDETIKKINFA